MKIKILEPNRKEPLAILAKQIVVRVVKSYKIETIKDALIYRESEALRVCFWGKKGGLSIYHALRIGKELEKVGLIQSVYDLGNPRGDCCYDQIAIVLFNEEFKNLTVLGK